MKNKNKKNKIQIKTIEDRPVISDKNDKTMLDAHTRFAVTDCICRKEATMLSEGCDKLMETCMTFGVAADYYIENEIGREITKEEAIEILQKAEEDGLVHFSSNHAEDKIFMCNCCGCCCKALAAINKYDNPGLIVKSNYYALVDTNTCDGCETCNERCQVNAIQVENDLASVSMSKCIGCGLCVSTCPNEALSMIHKETDALSHIYANDFELMQARGEDTKRPYPFE